MLVHNVASRPSLPPPPPPSILFVVVIFLSCTLIFTYPVGQIGNLTKDVFEPRTATGNIIFPFLERFHAIAFVTSSHSHQQGLFLSVVRSKTTPKKGNSLLPFAVRDSRTSVLKLPNIKWKGSPQSPSLFAPQTYLL